MNGLSTEGRTRGAAGRISTANGLVLFCTTVHEALVKFEKARADKAAADAAIAAERAQQLAIEQPVTSALHRLGFVVDLGKPVTIDAMKAFIRAQLQLSDVPKVNKTGNRETLYANVQRILETQNVRFLRADELDHACRSCAKLYDENERDANGDGLQWMGCEVDGCGAWFCPRCAPTADLPTHDHPAISSTSMPPPPPVTLSRSSSLSAANVRKRANSISSSSSTLSKIQHSANLASPTTSSVSSLTISTATTTSVSTTMSNATSSSSTISNNSSLTNKSQTTISNQTLTITPAKPTKRNAIAIETPTLSSNDDESNRSSKRPKRTKTTAFLSPNYEYE